MSLYAIGDLHLHFQSELKAPGQLHDRIWKNHEQKFQRNCEKLLTWSGITAGEKICLRQRRICSTSAICREEKY